MPNEQPYMLCKQDEKAKWFIKKRVKQAIQYNVTFTVTIPLDKLQSARAILRILQMEVVVARENCSCPTDKTVIIITYDKISSRQEQCTLAV